MIPTRFKLRKAMLTVFWDINRIVLINWLSPGQSFKGAYFSQEIIILLATILQAGWQRNEVPFTLLHIDNGKPHNSKSNLEQMMQLGFKRAIHPPYSQNITPFDFPLRLTQKRICVTTPR
jgi:hypothetical protein